MEFFCISLLLIFSRSYIKLRRENVSLQTTNAVNEERIKRFENDLKIHSELYVSSLHKIQELENAGKYGVMGYFGYMTRVQ